MRQAECPPAETWSALLADEPPPGAAVEWVRHLESCGRCQARLEGTAAHTDTLLRLAREVGDPTRTPADPDESRFLERLQGVRSPLTSAEPIDLFFLQPADRPGLLGMLDQYEVREVIGAGGMGVVLEAYEPALDRLVAIKVMAPSLAGSAVARRRFTREAHAAAAVVHDHVVTVHAVHDSGRLPYLVMQYVAGESLQDRLDRTGPLEVLEVVRIGMQTALGLAAAHAQGLIHRDIKPANLLLEGDPIRAGSVSDGPLFFFHPGSVSDGPLPSRVKITDFGLARTADDVSLTQNGVVAGTPEYMAPEQARGETVDHRADLFSLGSVLYAMTTGVPPFRASTAVGVLRQVSDQAPRPVRELNPDAPAWLEAFIERLMAKDPGERFQTASDTAALLQGCLAHLSQPDAVALPSLPPGPAGGAVVRRAWRGWRVAGFLLAASVASLLLFQAVPLPAPAPAGGFYQDFRDGAPPASSLQFYGPDTASVSHPELGGFRITLPRNRKHNERAGLQMKTRIRGDFEVASSYEILQTDQPTQGHGVGFDLFVQTDTPRHDVVEVARASRVNEGEVYTCSRISTDDQGKRTFHHDFPPAAGKSGRLRIVRIGRTATLWGAEGAAGADQKLCEYDLGPEDMILVTVTAFPGYAANFLDLRILDLRVRSLSAGETQVAQPPVAEHRDEASRGWSGAAGVVGLLILLFVSGGLVLQRRSGREKESATRPALGKEAVSEATGPPLSIRCPGCERALRVRAELAGKKVRCPQCSEAIPVPSDRSGP